VIVSNKIPGVLALLIACVLASASEAQSPAQDRARAFAEAVNRPLVYHVPGEESVRVRRNLVYRQEPEAKADVYQPRNSQNTKMPIVILIHGGVGPEVTFRPKDWGFYREYGRLLAASGLVAVTFNHRLGYPQPFMDEAADDVARLISYIREHAAEYGADPDRICLAVYSAGGPLLSGYIRTPPPYLRCLAAFYSVLDIRDSELHRRFMTAAQRKAFSPAAQLEKHADRLPPMFVARAGRDQIPGLNTWMEKFLDVAVKKNASITLAIHPTGAHGFENSNDDDRSREIIRMAVEFLRTHLSLTPAR
jgi:acetyl esterase/lipase